MDRDGAFAACEVGGVDVDDGVLGVDLAHYTWCVSGVVWGFDGEESRVGFGVCD